MEQHDTDPTQDPEDPWAEAGRRWTSIGDKLRGTYRELAREEGPSEDDIRRALDTLGEAARAVADSVGSAMRDPDLRQQVKDAAASLVTAVGQTFSQLGDELREEPGPDAGDEEE